MLLQYFDKKTSFYLLIEISFYSNTYCVQKNCVWRHPKVYVIIKNLQNKTYFDKNVSNITNIPIQIEFFEIKKHI